MANTNLKEAKAAKNDEFYTQFHDIEIEMNAYLEYDPDVFRGKIVLLPCDDPEWSNFTRYFAAKFDELGLKKLISTSYAPDSKKYKTPYQPSLFDTAAKDTQKSKKLSQTILAIKDKYGKDAMLRGMNFEEAATTRERNHQIGGHKSGK